MAWLHATEAWLPIARPVASCQLPVPDNPENQVCAFLLYRDDSANENADGTFNISPDFALPSMHQGQFCVSPLFMDNPAVCGSQTPQDSIKRITLQTQPKQIC